MANNKRKVALTDDPRAPKQPTLDIFFASLRNEGDVTAPIKPSTKHCDNPFLAAKPSTTKSTTSNKPSNIDNSKNKPTANSTTTVTSKFFTLNPSTSASTPKVNPKVIANKANTHSTHIEVSNIHRNPICLTIKTPEYFEDHDFNLEDVLDDSKSLSTNKACDSKSNSNKGNATNNHKKSTFYDKYSNQEKTDDREAYGKYVKMPYDSKNTYICPHTSEKRPKWELITTVLRETINSASDFQEALLTYNPTYRGEWSFVGLHQFINAMDPAERSSFFSRTLPAIVDLALSLPNLMTGKLPLLLPGAQHQIISLTQHQIASLLANAFLCTFPRRNKSPKAQKHYTKSYNYHNNGGADNMPSINFSGLFGKPGKAIVNKLRCILNYFRRVVNAPELGRRVDFERRQITSNSFPDWKDSKAKLPSLHVYAEGTIEDSDTNFLHVDFSNKYIGGGVIGRGCVQEEIMFCIYPELIVARLFNAMLTDNECCIFTGAEKYSTYSGYSDSFVFLADYVDTTPRIDGSHMDALNFKYAVDQYDAHPILRELNKAYCAFFVPPKMVARPISTGNWGCGAFNGDLELKAVIQLMASAVCKRTLHYFTFENSLFANNLGAIHDFLVTNDITVGELWGALVYFCNEKFKRKEDQAIAAHAGVFNFLQLYFTNKKTIV